MVTFALKEDQGLPEMFTPFVSDNVLVQGNIGASNATLRLQSCTRLPVHATSLKSLSYSILRASETAELRAAAYLRASSFYSYPADRSEYAKRSHLRMKADSTWKALEERVLGEDIEYKDVFIVPLVAVVDWLGETDSCFSCLKKDMADASCMLPVSETRARPQIVIGTLDLNQCAKLPAEELMGKLPVEGNRSVLRAYLSNVCVANAARRCGVAAELIRVAEQEAYKAGVKDLYVHVVRDNAAAIGLYIDKCGFEIESEEGAEFARILQRPRRLLLHKAVVG